MSVHPSFCPPLFKYNVISLTNHPISFLDAPSHLYKRVCPSISPSVGPSPLFKCIIPLTNHDTSFLDASSHLHTRVCPSVGPLVHPLLFKCNVIPLINHPTSFLDHPHISVRGQIWTDGWMDGWTNGQTGIGATAIKRERSQRNYPRHREEEGDCPMLVGKWLEISRKMPKKQKAQGDGIPRKMMKGDKGYFKHNSIHPLLKLVYSASHERYQTKGLGHCNRYWGSH